MEPDPGALPEDPAKVRTVLQHQLTDNAGVLRDAERLTTAAAAVEAVLRAPSGTTVADHELHNLATVARAVVEAARQREESRGAHTRDDFTETSPAFAHRIATFVA